MLIMKRRREEYINLITFGEGVAPMFVELFGPLTGLEEEWRKQGASEDEISLRAFDWDYTPVTGCGGNTGIAGGFEPEVLEDNEEYTIGKDALGRTVKLCKKSASIPLPLDYPVNNMDDWRKIKHLYSFNEGRIDAGAVEKAAVLQKKGVLVLGSIPGGFDLPRQLMGEENLCMAFYDQPELVHDILETVGDTAFKVFDEITRTLIVDNLSVHEDMAGKSGPLAGPNIVDEFIKPYYLRIWELLSGRGAKIFSQDSDGNINKVIDVFLQSGVNLMYPAEPAAGMDIVALRSRYGRKIAFKGGIDKHVLRKNKKEILRELEYKMQPLMREGGTVFGLDHRIPNGTSIENYRYYVEKGREILGMEPYAKAGHDWHRMAF